MMKKYEALIYSAAGLIALFVLLVAFNYLAGRTAVKADLTQGKLYTLSEGQVVAQLTASRGAGAAASLTRVYKRLRALPSRGQAAAPWSTGHLARREFDSLYRDVAELCRTLGHDLTCALEV